MTRITFKSLKHQGILQKLAAGIMLMMILPFLLMTYLLFTEASFLLRKDSVQLAALLIVASASSGYLLIRSVIISVIKLTKDAQSIVQGNLNKRITTSEKNEINDLAQYFNQITGELEKNLTELKESKRVLHDVLMRIGNSMSSDQKTETILELIMKTLVNAVNAASGVMMIITEDTLSLKTEYGLTISDKATLKIAIGSGVIGWVAKEKKAQKVTRTQQDRRFDSEVRRGLAHKSILCAPLLYRDKILGTISVHDRQDDDEFSDEDALLLENLASQTAIALENSRLNEDIERVYIETISALAMAVEAKDPYSRGHTKRVKDYATAIAQRFGMDKDSIRTLQDAALLHDIGKIGIRDDILLKPAVLNQEERKQMQRHAIIGENILKPIQSLKNVAYLARHHQEQVNGKGYPDGLTGEKMTLPLKILIVADAFDAMTSDRPYRKGMTKEQAKKELKKYSGIYFDPEVVNKFTEQI